MTTESEYKGTELKRERFVLQHFDTTDEDLASFKAMVRCMVALESIAETLIDVEARM